MVVASAVRVRRAGTSDAGALAALRWAWAAEHGLVPGSEDFAAFAGAFADWQASAPNHHPVLAAEAGEPIGMGWLAVLDRVPDVDRPVRRSGHVQTVVVLPEHRNHGVGARILDEIVGHARELGLDYLEVHPSERSYPFYRRLGFAGDGGTLRLTLRVRP